MTRPTTKDQLEWFINGVISLFEDLNKEFEDEKEMGFHITEQESGFKVHWQCLSVDIPSSSDDPTKDDSRQEYYESYFIWHPTERAHKLLSYITSELETMHNITIAHETEKDWD
jgi:hypothetical protein